MSDDVKIKVSNQELLNISYGLDHIKLLAEQLAFKVMDISSKDDAPYRNPEYSTKKHMF